MLCRVPYNGAFLVRKRQLDAENARRENEPVSFAISFR